MQAASGIGKETALAFAEAGVQGIIFADINIYGAKEAATESKYLARHPKYRAVLVEVDVSVETSVKDMFRIAIQEFGRVDYFVHSAGVSLVPPVGINL